MKRKGIDGIAKRGKTRLTKPKQSKPAKSYNMGGRVGRGDMGAAGRFPSRAAVDANNAHLMRGGGGTLRPVSPAPDSDAAALRRVPPDSDRQALRDAARARREAGHARAIARAGRNVGRPRGARPGPVGGGANGRGMKHGGKVKK